MTVAELIEELSEYDPETKVFVFHGCLLCEADVYETDEGIVIAES